MNKRERIKQVRRRTILLTIMAGGMLFCVVQGKGTVTSQTSKENLLPVEKGTDLAKIQPPQEQKREVDFESDNTLEVEAKRLAEAYSKLLLLVNHEHALKKENIPALRSICKGRLQAADCLYEDLCEMLEAAGKENHHFWIASAYRSREYQQEIIDRGVRTNLSQGMTYEEALEEVYRESMSPGHSEHETGMALDILASSNQNMDQSQENTPENHWLQQHCYEYGFILRYPKGKEEITGIAYEPWHVRYVGREAAAFLNRNDMTLEEFRELVD